MKKELHQEQVLSESLWAWRHQGKTVNNPRRGTAVIEQCRPASCDFAPRSATSLWVAMDSWQGQSTISTITSLRAPLLAGRDNLCYFATLLSLLREPGSSLFHDNVFTHWACPPQACRTPLELARKQRKSTVNVTRECGDGRKMS